MNRPRILPLVIALALFVGTPEALLLAEIPAWIGGEYAEETGRPLWVSLEEAAPNGEINWELVPEWTEKRLRDQIETSRKEYRRSRTTPDEKPCQSYILQFDTGRLGARSFDSIPEIAEFAELIAVGVVSNLSAGFFKGSPRTLFEIEIKEHLKKPTGTDLPRQLLVAYRGVAMPIGGGSYCVWERKGGELPAVGSSVMLALEFSPPRDAVITELEDQEIAFTLPDGETSLNGYFVDQSISLRQLISAVRDALEDRTN